MSLRLSSKAFFVAVFLSSTSMAYDRDSYRDTRLLGRGNTGIADFSGIASLFYNPAALAASSRVIFTPVDSSLGANKHLGTSFSQISTLTSSDQTLSEKFSPFLGKPMALQGTFFPHIMAPGFAVGFYDYADINIEYSDPVYPKLDLQARNDWGLIFGGGLNLGPNLQAGASIRYMKRKALNEVLDMASVFNLSASYLTEIMQNGEAWALNTGLRYHQNVGKSSWMSLGLVIEDAFGSKFKNANRGPLPTKQIQKINAGFAYGANRFKVLFDMKELDNADKSYTKKIFMGTEVAIPYATLRTGLFQGYWTAGVSTSIIPFFDLDITTYGEELSSAAGLREARYWLLGIRAGLDMDATKKKKQKYSLDHL